VGRCGIIAAPLVAVAVLVVVAFGR
jgi:hypothetical protein